MRRPHRRGRSPLLVVAGLVLAVSLASAQDGDAEPPEESGLVEQARTSLILIDLLVLDSYDRPLHGLAREDFRARLNGRKWPVETVDELCSCQTIVYPGAAGSSIQIELMSDASGWGCDCLYRVGLAPPADTPPRQIRSDVKLARPLRVTGHRIARLREGDTWWHEARAALARPELREQIAVEADLVPTDVGDTGWDLSVRVAVDPESLQWEPEGEELWARWEVGAVVLETSGDRVWDMLGVSELRRRRGRVSPTAEVLHQRTLHDVAAGSYEVRAFVRDRAAHEFGAAKAFVMLSDPSEAPVVGPRVMRSDAAFLPTQLPLQGKREAETSSRSSQPFQGSLPVGRAAVSAGEPLAFVTWICPGDGGPAEPAVSSWIFHDVDAVEVRRSTVLSRRGPCAMFTERLETSDLAPGAYTYYLRWDPGRNLDPRRAEAGFEIASGAAGRP